MAARRASRRAQRGAALLALLVVIVMTFAYVVTSRLNAASRFVSIDREHNAKVMNQAKQALIGWMAMNAAGTDAEPGRLPCPEAPGFYGDPDQEGIAAGSCVPPNNVGRLPWRTLGIDRPVDADGEPLWYAVSPGWSLPGATTFPINPDSAGQLTVDGAANDAVALVFAPGPAIGVQGGGGCTAWSQARPGSGTPDLRNYLECGNVSGSFVTSAAGSTFNDQVLRVRVSELMPKLEAAIQERAQREIAPALRDAAFQLTSHSPRRWESSSNPRIYPYAAPFSDPTASNFRGTVGTDQGLLPFASAAGFVGFASAPPNVVKITSAGSLVSGGCSWESATVWACEGTYQEDSSNPSLPITLQMTATFTNVAMGLRTADLSKLTAEARDDGGGQLWSTAFVSTSYRLEMNDGSVSGKPHGSVTVWLTATLPNIDSMGWATVAQYRLRVDAAVIADHCLLRTTTGTPCAGADTSWFARNQWHRNFYYAVADENQPGVLPAVGGCNSSDCLRFNSESLYNIRALLLLAGTRLATQDRSTSSARSMLSNYFEDQNADGGTRYEQRIVRPTVATPWNDRAILVDWNPSSPPVPNVASGPQVTHLSPRLRVYFLP